jgi:D-sedoheptulose 7-phosphate isomerase
MPGEIADEIRRAAATLSVVAEGSYAEAVERAVALLDEAFRAGRTLFVFGNGGSAADAQHLTAELVGRFTHDRPPFAAVALTTNQAVLTAWSNDHSFDDVFARQLEALGRTGDVAWGISTSGRSRNVVLGLERARDLGLRTIALTGRGGGALAQRADVLLAVPLDETSRIQEAHLVTYHAVCRALDRLRLTA